MLKRDPALLHTTIVFGGSDALQDARRFEIPVVQHAPLCGHSIIGLGRMQEFCRALRTSDVIIGWGSQFRSVFDRIAPHANAVVIDLATGVPNVRTLMQSAWHALSALPARLDSAPLPTPKGFIRGSSEEAITIGLCREAPTIEQIAAFTYALGGVAVSGFKVDAIIPRHFSGARRMIRHTREGGRLNCLRAIDRPLPLAAECAQLWLFASTSKSGRSSQEDFDWSTMLAADALAASGASVLAALPSSAKFDPTIAPRTLFATAETLSDVAGFIHRRLEGSMADAQSFQSTSLVSRLTRIARTISVQEPILNLEHGSASDE